jgi:hypothetical protein
MANTNDAKKKSRVLLLKKESKAGNEYFQLVTVDDEGKFHNVVGSNGNQVLAFPVKSGKGHLSLFESRGQGQASEALTFASAMSSL